MQFLLVYIAEAHAMDGRSPNTRRGAPLVEEPATLKERLAVAGRCAVGLSLKTLPTVVDLLDNKVSATWSAHPDRLYLITKDGTLGFVGGRGPQGFRPDQLEKAIRSELGLKDNVSGEDREEDNRPRDLF